MNNEEYIETMKSAVEKIERANHRERYLTEVSYKKNVVNAILNELEKVVEDENI